MSKRLQIDSGQAIRVGWMEKQGHVNKAWKQRWMQLMPKKLYYFRDQQNSTPDGVWDLTEVTFSKVENLNKRPYGIAIDEGKRTTYVSCKSAEERDSWLESIKEASEGNTAVLKDRISAHLKMTVISGRNLAAKNKNFLKKAASDPYVLIKCGNKTKNTKTVESTLNPTWNEDFSFFVSSTSATLDITVFDQETSALASSSLGSSLGVKDEFMGSIQLPIPKIQELMEAQPNGKDGKKQPIEQWFPLEKISKDDKVTGDLLLKIYFEESTRIGTRGVGGDGASVVSASTFQSTVFGAGGGGGGGGGGGLGGDMELEDLQSHLNELEEQIQMYAEDRAKIVRQVSDLFFDEYRKYIAPPKKLGQLYLSGLQGRKLANMDGVLGKSDPYLVIKFQDQEKKSTVQPDTLNPKWDGEAFTFDIMEKPIDIMIEIFDEDPGKDESMGFVSVAIQQHLAGSEPGDEVQRWYDVADLTGKGKAAGELQVTLKMVEFEDDSDEQVASTAPKAELTGDEWGKAFEIAKLVKKKMGEEVGVQERIAEKMIKAKEDIEDQLTLIFGESYEQYCRPRGELHMLIAEARGLVTEKVLGVAKQLDAYAVVEFQGEVTTTGVVRSLSPKWDANTIVPVVRDLDVIKVDVFNKRPGKDNLLGSGNINLGEFVLEEGVERTDWFPLKLDGAAAGEVRLELTYKRNEQSESVSSEQIKVPGITNPQAIIQKAYAVQQALLEAAKVQKAQYMLAKTERDQMVRQLYDLFATDYEVYCRPRGELQLSVVEGRSLRVMDKGSKSADPYVTVDFQDQSVKTETVKGSVDPKWNSEFALSLIRELDEVTLTVYDWNALGKDSPMGQIIIDFTEIELEHDMRIQEWFELQPMDGMKDPEGSILIELCFLDNSVGNEAGTAAAASSSSSSSSSSTNGEGEEGDEEEEEDLEKVLNEGIVKARGVKEALKDQLEVRKAQYLRAKKDRDDILSQLRELFSDAYRKYCRPLGVLTVKVGEAKDLKKMDLGGSSDPFCELFFQDQHYVTSVKKKNLNPNWNEVFKFSVYEIPQTFKLLMYDQDDPLLGQKEPRKELMATLRLHLGDTFGEALSDGEWHEKWFEFSADDAGKKGAGQVLLSFRHVLPEQLDAEEAPIMEALVEANAVRDALERSIQNQAKLVKDARKLTQDVHRLYASEYAHWISTRKADFPTLYVTVVGARDLAAADIMEGTSDPFCVLSVSGEESEHKTNVVDKTLDPEWNESFKFRINNPSTAELTIKVYDHDDKVLGIGGGSDYLGEVNIATFALQEDKELDAWIPLKSPKRRFGLYKIKGELHVKVTYTWRIEAEDDIPEEDTDEEARFALETMKKARVVKKVMMAHLKDLKTRVQDQEEQLVEYEKELRRTRDAEKRASLLERKLARAEKEQTQELNDMRERYEAQLRDFREIVAKKDAEIDRLNNRGIFNFGKGKSESST